MAKHADRVEPATTGQRVARTTIQTALAASIGLALILPSVIDAIDQEVGEHLPHNFRLWMLGVAGTITVLSSLAARVMAMPAVNAWLARWTGLGTLKSE